MGCAVETSKPKRRRKSLPTARPYGELSEEAKARARDCWREKGWTWDQWDSGDLTDLFAEVLLEEYGIEVAMRTEKLSGGKTIQRPDIFWSLSYCQGDGVSFTARRSVAFFLADGPIADEPAVLWRLRPSVNAEGTEGQFLRLCEQYHNLEMWCCEHVQTSLPQVDYDADSFRYNDAEELAKRVLRELPLGNWPGQSLLNVLEEVCGVKVFYLEFEPSGTAASTVSESFGAAVLLNVNNVRWRRNFDLAHELFHLLTWKSFHGDSAKTTAVSEQEEKFADCFASNLLMPTDPFRTAINARILAPQLASSE